MDHSHTYTFSFRRDHLEDLDIDIEPLAAIVMRIVGIIRIIFGLFLASNITSLYFLITIIGIPIFILILSLFSKFLKILNIYFSRSILEIFRSSTIERV